MLYKKTKGRTARRGAIFAAAVALSALGGSALAQTTITIESWRNDDSDIWNNQIIPAFEKAQSRHRRQSTMPTSPPEYNAALNSRLEGGAAGDIITCRPVRRFARPFQQGLPDAAERPARHGRLLRRRQGAWTTDDGKTTFCVPMASVIHGFFYNKKIFEELG